MPGIALGLMFLGYSVAYYGYTQVTGGNWGFLDLVVPSRWAGAAGTPPDSPAGVNVAVPKGGISNKVGGGPGLSPSGSQPPILQKTGNGQATDQFGNLYNNVNGVWIPTGTSTAPGSVANAPHPT